LQENPDIHQLRVNMIQ